MGSSSTTPKRSSHHKPSTKLASRFGRWPRIVERSHMSGPAFIGGQALVFARAMVATNSHGPTRALSDLANTPHSKALCAELCKLPTFASGPQIAEMIGTSWAVLALSKGLARSSQGIFLVEEGASVLSTASNKPQRVRAGQQGAPCPLLGPNQRTKTRPILKLIHCETDGAPPGIIAYHPDPPRGTSNATASRS